METTYTQLSLEERCTIALLYKEGQSLRKIAATLDRHPSYLFGVFCCARLRRRKLRAKQKAIVPLAVPLPMPA